LGKRKALEGTAMNPQELKSGSYGETPFSFSNPIIRNLKKSQFQQNVKFYTEQNMAKKAPGMPYQGL
jgi:hypothetical protein